MSHWNKDWTIETVEQNYRVLGCIDPEDVVQLFADAKLLAYLKEHLGQRGFNEVLELAQEREYMDRDV